MKPIFPPLLCIYERLGMPLARIPEGKLSTTPVRNRSKMPFALWLVTAVRASCLQVKEFISSELLAQLYALGESSALMDESLEQQQHREEVLSKHAALKEALAVIGTISTSTCTTPVPPPVDSSWIQPSRYRPACSAQGCSDACRRPKGSTWARHWVFSSPPSLRASKKSVTSGRRVARGHAPSVPGTATRTRPTATPSAGGPQEHTSKPKRAPPSVPRWLPDRTIRAWNLTCDLTLTSSLSLEHALTFMNAHHQTLRHRGTGAGGVVIWAGWGSAGKCVSHTLFPISI